MKYSKRFEAALVYASQVHEGHFRKGTQVPYITHLMAVAALVGEAGGTENEVIAALLHDAVEDCGGPPIEREIRERFGDTVGDIVIGCSDTDETPKPPWQKRKKATSSIWMTLPSRYCWSPVLTSYTTPGPSWPTIARLATSCGIALPERRNKRSGITELSSKRLGDATYRLDWWTSWIEPCRRWKT